MRIVCDQKEGEQMMQATAISPEFINLKTRLKKTWMAGDYDRFSR
jgi:hypothetical protein